jgi:hypothetical protein
MTAEATLALEQSLAARLDELEARLARALAELEDLTGLVTHANQATEPSASEPTEPIHATLTDWVDGYFSHVFARSVGGETRWCAYWRDHPEAVTRLEALWRSWETLRLDPNLGIVTWLTSYLDPQLAALLARSGTFAQCSTDRHTSPTQLPLDG